MPSSGSAATGEQWKRAKLTTKWRCGPLHPRTLVYQDLLRNCLKGTPFLEKD